MTPVPAAARTGYLVVLAAVLGVAVLLAAVPALLWLLLDSAARTSLQDFLGVALAGRGPLLALAILVVLVAASALLLWLWRGWSQPVAQLAEALEFIEHAGATALPALQRPAALAALSRAVAARAAGQAAAAARLEAHVAAARGESERARARLAALVEDLDGALILCNAGGHILLYNRAASRLFEGTGWLGLGRELAQLVGPAQMAFIQHALGGAELAAGAPPPLHFTTTTEAGRLLQLRVAAMREQGGLSGLIVQVSDRTVEAASARRREAALGEIAATAQAGLAGLASRLRGGGQGAGLVELERDAQALAERLRRALHEEMTAVRSTVQREAMPAADLLRAARRRIESRLGLVVDVATVDTALRVRVEGFMLVQALAFLATRVQESAEARSLTLSLQADGGVARLTMGWAGTALSYETVLGWELESMSLGGEDSRDSVREVLRLHGTELAYERDRAATRASFTLLLPLADAPTPEPGAAGAPAACDLTLLDWTDVVGSAAEQPLAELVFTVFDTETTGLDPAQDEIIQIGAVRIVRGRMRREEQFLQLVDPEREISAASLQIHGIARERLRGQPGIARVLPRLREFVAGSVLVGHNVAFDLAFLRRKEGVSGITFDMPVLDTLLLSGVLHPNQDSHRLEAIAERFGVGVLNRHDALADALMTAQVFERMIPLLAARGIHTLAEAREASLRSPHAHLEY